MKTAIDLMDRPEVEPNRFFELMDNAVQGLREFRLIFAALELGVFENLKTPFSAQELSKKLGCDPALMPYFCEALCGLGLLSKLEYSGPNSDSGVSNESGIGNENAEVKYVNSKLSSTYFLKDSAFSQQHYLSEKHRDAEIWARLSEIMKIGPVVFPKAGFFREVIQCMAENARCGLLQDTVKTVQENVDFSKVQKLLDLGGGHRARYGP